MDYFMRDYRVPYLILISRDRQDKFQSRFAAVCQSTGIHIPVFTVTRTDCQQRVVS